MAKSLKEYVTKAIHYLLPAFSGRRQLTQSWSRRQCARPSYTLLALYISLQQPHSVYTANSPTPHHALYPLLNTTHTCSSIPAEMARIKATSRATIPVLLPLSRYDRRLPKHPFQATSSSRAQTRLRRDAKERFTRKTFNLIGLPGGTSPKRSDFSHIANQNQSCGTKSMTTSSKTSPKSAVVS